MIQVKKYEITLINKPSHCIFVKARTLSLLVLKTDLKCVSKKNYLPYLERRIHSLMKLRVALSTQCSCKCPLGCSTLQLLTRAH